MGINLTTLEFGGTLLLPLTLPYTKVVGLLEKVFIYPLPILIRSTALNKPKIAYEYPQFHLEASA